MKSKKRNRILITAFISSVLILAIIIYGIPNIADLFKKTAVLEYGNLPISNEVTAYLIRDEKIYLADRTGEISYFISEGVKVRKNTSILEIKDKQIDNEEESEYKDVLRKIGDETETFTLNTAQSTGSVGYFIDGNEYFFTPSNMKDISKQEAENKTEGSGGMVSLARETTRKGEPVFKLVDNSAWYMIFWLDIKSGDVQKFVSGNEVTIDFGDGDVKGYVLEILEQDDNWLIIIKFNKYYKRFAQVRKADVSVIVADYQGLIVDNASIDVVKGKKGLYVRQTGGDYLFTPINVIQTDGSHSLLSVGSFTDEDGKQINTVDYYDEILVDPEDY